MGCVSVTLPKPTRDNLEVGQWVLFKLTGACNMPNMLKQDLK